MLPNRINNINKLTARHQEVLFSSRMCFQGLWSPPVWPDGRWREQNTWLQIAHPASISLDCFSVYPFNIWLWSWFFCNALWIFRLTYYIPAVHAVFACNWTNISTQIYESYVYECITFQVYILPQCVCNLLSCLRHSHCLINTLLTILFPNYSSMLRRLSWLNGQAHACAKHRHRHCLRDYRFWWCLFSQCR